jgi:hypothetical protein
MMTLRRFRTLADSYGGDLQRWPETMRLQAQALLDTSAEARRIIVGARKLDDVIAAAQAAHSEHLWSGDRAEAALERLRNGVAIRIAPTMAATPIRAVSLLCTPLGIPRRVRWISLATAASVAILAGFVLGIRYSPAAPQQDELSALLQPSPIQLPTE